LVSCIRHPLALRADGEALAAAQRLHDWCPWGPHAGVLDAAGGARDDGVARSDAQAGADAGQPLGEALTADGIDEFRTLWLGTH
jgi:hypothetical protein